MEKAWIYNDIPCIKSVFMYFSTVHWTNREKKKGGGNMIISFDEELLTGF